MEKLGNTFKNTSLVSPLNAESGKADPGPGILNTPLIDPNDPQGFLTDSVKPASGRKKG
jgi:hypothetical protein